MIWLCRSDPISFSVPYSQIADLNITLLFGRTIDLLERFKEW